LVVVKQASFLPLFHDPLSKIVYILKQTVISSKTGQFFTLGLFLSGPKSNFIQDPKKLGCALKQINIRNKAG
jgi:hypothetical protein